MSLLQFEDDIMPFTFADVLILRYLIRDFDEDQTVIDFNLINVTCMILMGLASSMGAALGYDKVTQTLKQLSVNK